MNTKHILDSTYDREQRAIKRRGVKVIEEPKETKRKVFVVNPPTSRLSFGDERPPVSYHAFTTRSINNNVRKVPYSLSEAADYLLGAETGYIVEKPDKGIFFMRLEQVKKISIIDKVFKGFILAEGDKVVSKLMDLGSSVSQVDLVLFIPKINTTICGWDLMGDGPIIKALRKELSQRSESSVNELLATAVLVKGEFVNPSKVVELREPLESGITEQEALSTWGFPTMLNVNSNDTQPYLIPTLMPVEMVAPKMKPEKRPTTSSLPEIPRGKQICLVEGKQYSGIGVYPEYDLSVISVPHHNVFIGELLATGSSAITVAEKSFNNGDTNLILYSQKSKKLIKAWYLPTSHSFSYFIGVHLIDATDLLLIKGKFLVRQ